MGVIPAATALSAPAGFAAPVTPLLRAAPPPARGLIARDRLVRRLLSTAGVRVVLLSAPPGYGKTTLLEAWDQADPRPFRWLTPGPGPLGRARWAAELRAIAAAPERVPEPSVVVIDGWPAGAGEAIRDVVARAQALPPRCLLVVSARTTAAVPVGRLRAEHELLELTARDLALTHDEARELLEAAGVGLPAAGLDALLASCVGWPAALSLAGQALAAESDPGAAAATFGGDDPYITDYVRDELLAPLPSSQRRFLRRCSVLDTLDADVCDATLGGLGSAAVLAALEGSELPVDRVERGSRRLRCHPLLRAVLRSELRRAEPGADRELHRRASAFFAERDDLEAAVAHAIAGGDLDRAGALLWRVALISSWDARRERLAGWLARLGPRAADAHPALALSAALLELTALDVARIQHRLAVADPRRAPAPLRRSLRAGHLVLAGLTEPVTVAAMRERAAEVRALAEPAGPAWALGCLLEGVVATIAGDRGRAVPALEEGARRAAIGAPGVAALCQAELALGWLCVDEWEEGACLAERARARVDALGIGGHEILALVTAVSAFARAHRGRFTEARMDVEAADRVLADGGELPPWYAAQVGLALARAELRLSDVAGARSRLADVQRAAQRLGDAPVLSGWIDAAWRAAEATAAAALGPAEALTPAELRVLQFLPSHRSFREIGGCLHVTANTVKSQVHAVYRKLGASSRSAAVQRAQELGLLDAGAGGSPGSDEARAVGRS